MSSTPKDATASSRRRTTWPSIARKPTAKRMPAAGTFASVGLDLAPAKGLHPLPFPEDFRLEDREPRPGLPVPRGQAGLEAQMVEHLVAPPSLLGRDLREKDGRAAVLRKKDAVPPDHDVAGSRHGLHRSQDRDLDPEARQLLQGDRGKAAVVHGGLDGH